MRCCAAAKPRFHLFPCLCLSQPLSLRHPRAKTHHRRDGRGRALAPHPVPRLVLVRHAALMRRSATHSIFIGRLHGRAHRLPCRLWVGEVSISRLTTFVSDCMAADIQPMIKHETDVDGMYVRCFVTGQHSLCAAFFYADFLDLQECACPESTRPPPPAGCAANANGSAPPPVNAALTPLGSTAHAQQPAPLPASNTQPPPPPQTQPPQPSQHLPYRFSPAANWKQLTGFENATQFAASCTS